MQQQQTRQQRRRQREIEELRTSGYLLDVISKDDSDGNLELLCRLDGPDNTAYADRAWTVRITLSSAYPYKSPSIGFVDVIFHPNVDQASGSVCLNALNTEWTPVYKLVYIIETMLPQLLTYPNADDPMNADAATVWSRNSADAFAARVRDCV